MIDKQAIEALQEARAIDAANDNTPAPYVTALPENFKLHDLEKHMSQRRRAIGTMSTTSAQDFANYIKDHAEAGATVFVSTEAMKAVAVLNLGTPEEPGHADNLAVLDPKKTAAFSALLAIANGHPRSQQDVAEFLEDWPSMVSCYNDEGNITNAKAIAAVRKITIEALRKLESEEQSLSASRSAFESVAATSKEPLPTTIYFTCVPYVGLAERTFVLRLGVLTSGDKPSIVLRIVKAEEHAEEMGNELAALIADKFSNGDGDAPPVLLGSYTATP